MDTDKNGWPYLVGLFLCFASIGVAVGSGIAPFWVLATVLVSVWCFGFFVPLFLTLVFSKTLKPISLHKKLAFAFCPCMYASLKWRYWVLQELEPDCSYEQFVERISK